MTIDKKSLCAAFCGDLELTEVPAGLAVRTAFYGKHGDALGFYITANPYDRSKYRLEDSGMIVPELEAAGVDLERGTRADAFLRLLQEYGAEFDHDALEIRSQYVEEAELPSEAMRFIALLLRVRDFELLSPEQVESTFRQDAERVIEESFAGKAKIEFHAAPAAGFSEFEADAVISHDNETVAVYLATHDARVDEAVMVWYVNKYERRGNLRVALLLESSKPPQISGRILTRALNRLDATPGFRGDEMGAMAKIASIAGIQDFQWQH